MTLLQNLQQFIRFGVVGTIGAAVDFGSYGLMTRVLGWGTVYCVSLQGTFVTDVSRITHCTSPHYPLVAANMVSVLLAISSNFFLNKFWTFRDPRVSRMAVQGVSYVVMSVITWGLNQVLTGFFASRLVILHTVFGSYVDVSAKVLSILVVLFFNYSGSKFVIFGSRRTAPRQV